MPTYYSGFGSSRPLKSRKLQKKYKCIHLWMNLVMLKEASTKADISLTYEIRWPMEAPSLRLAWLIQCHIFEMNSDKQWFQMQFCLGCHSFIHVWKHHRNFQTFSFNLSTFYIKLSNELIVIYSNYAGNDQISCKPRRLSFQKRDYWITFLSINAFSVFQVRKFSNLLIQCNALHVVNKSAFIIKMTLVDLQKKTKLFTC